MDSKMAALLLRDLAKETPVIIQSLKEINKRWPTRSDSVIIGHERKNSSLHVIGEIALGNYNINSKYGEMWFKDTEIPAQKPCFVELR